ncbi:MAG: DUF2177 family protein [Candidatus Gracilibacteria bacterium]|nr:DUF2177 family protein [Candidatus Gracilibacteria bacterium]
MTLWIKLYLATVPVFFAIDILWIAYLAKDLYRNNIGYYMADKPNWTAALFFYLLFIIGILYFGVKPGIEQNNWQIAALNGGLFGFFTYATYDLTNLAVAKDWPLNVTLIDMAWGTLLCTLVATSSFFIYQWIN